MDTRQVMMSRLKEDLIGPYTDEEIIAARPSDVYLTGILWPMDTRVGLAEDERLQVGTGDKGELSVEEEISIVGQMRPCNAGISFALNREGTEPAPSISIEIAFGLYTPISQSKMANMADSADTYDPKKKAETFWKRTQNRVCVSTAIGDQETKIDLQKYGMNKGINVYVRTVKWQNNLLVTTNLINEQLAEDNRSESLEKITMFQVSMTIRPSEGTKLVNRPSRCSVSDDDDRSAALLYRAVYEYAAGHNCSAQWDIKPGTKEASSVSIAWIPEVKVNSMDPKGSKTIASIYDQEESVLSAEWLSSSSDAQLQRALSQLPMLYERWINEQQEKIRELTSEDREQALKNLENCKEACARMKNGVEAIMEDPFKKSAFRLSNLAMNLQYRWNPENKGSNPLIWRPFQLGFILLAANSVVSSKDPGRKIMDLLWFPTGGGKTEAYLGLIAYLLFHRRLTEDEKEKNGVNSIMRYTLRTLTTQQFQRATAMVLACEAIRRKKYPDNRKLEINLGNNAFSIGLWVGSDATPNTFEKAEEALKPNSKEPSPEQISTCPCCQGNLEWKANKEKKKIEVFCTNPECMLYAPGDTLPVWTVDEDIYREKPSLLLGTVDKFAQIVRKNEIHELFSVGKNPPDLIIQDELHLISGPLGTLAALYEVAIDRMFSPKEGGRPKIIGSTATIRRASEQICALFDRDTCQFPPAAIDSYDSGFAVMDEEGPGRIYAAVSTLGRSAKFSLQAVVSSLQQAVWGALGSETERDPYWTLLAYFNSLRELGGALVLMQDDVVKSIELLAERRKEKSRKQKSVEELTSRRTQTEVRDMLEKLKVPSGEDGALDIVLATNMFSVGVDIPRLGLMVVNGQPKGISEYVQATSRVGRGSVPGLIISILNNAKPRDRSHFESFGTWHSTLYRDVEATSVTPFSSRARDKALHAVLVTLVRHLVPGMLKSPNITAETEEQEERRNELIEYIVERGKRIDPEERLVEEELENLLQTWEARSPTFYWNPHAPNRSLLQSAELAAAHKALGKQPGQAWPTLNSLRSVEPETSFRLVKLIGNDDQSEED